MISSTDPAVARRLVLSVPPGLPEMEAHRRHILDLIDALPAPADRMARPGHLTGSALVLDSTGERILVLLHHKLGIWVQPGGHADGETNLVAVALREATEETGINGLLIDPIPVDLDVHQVAPPAEDPHLHLDVRFLVTAPPGAMPQRNQESDDIRWVVPDELPGLGADAGLIRLAAAAATRRRA